jgi:hypothetical protein
MRSSHYDAGVRREELGRWSRAMIAPGVGVVTTTVCIWFVPNVWQLGLGVSFAAVVAPLVFEWLTEELGEA